MTQRDGTNEIAIVGAGPAGLWAAEIIAEAGHHVTVYERMASPARKFLLAGRGGLNLTHSEPLEAFLARYGAADGEIRSAVEAYPPTQLTDWANGLGAKTFVGSSGRVFPDAMKASPLLRAWLRRLETLGVTIKTRHRWMGFTTTNELSFETPDGADAVKPDASIFALGGASWPKLGSDGSWVDLFREAGIDTTPLRPANCGIRVRWSDIFKARFEGAALKRIAVSIAGIHARGEAVVTSTGLEGGVIYALVRDVRSLLESDKPATLMIDLKPDLDQATLAKRLSHRRPKETLTNFIRKAAHLDPAAVALLREAPLCEKPGALPENREALAARIKALPLQVVGLTGLEKAISTAGGIAWSELDPHLMIKSRPGTFVAGEMLDWEAPTGGYLLQGTFATAATAAKGLLSWLSLRQ